MKNSIEKINKDFKHYEVIKKLGSGNFSDVYLATQVSTGQKVAIKILRTDEQDSPKAIENKIARFQREMKLCGAMNHPNIIKVLDFGESNNNLFTVFEYIPGLTLGELIKEKGGLSITDTKDPKTRLDSHLNKALAKQDFKKALEVADSISKYGKLKKDLAFESYGYDAKAEIYAFQNNIPLAKKFTLKKKQAIEFLHAENDHDDFEKEILLPHRNSQHGPELAVADVNNDGLQDVFFCNAYKQPSVLYLQTSPGVFKKKNVTAFTTDKNKEDVGAHFFDYNNDGFMDLYVASGGNEFEDQTNSYKHRLYKNDGKGNFTNDYRSLPDFAVSGKEVTSADFDGDGDLDLFVGGRLTPAKYPFAPRSYLLINNNGVFEDKTKELAPDLMNPGLVTDAKWFDYDGDKDLDLMVVGEWMPLLLLKNENGKLSKVESAANLYENTGWWYSIETADFDGDGDEDIVVGNLGLNYKYKASKDEPFQIWCHDFDNSGSLDIVLGYYDHGACFPVRGRTCSSQQMPFIKEKFPTFNDFASATIEDIYGSQLSDALNYKATTFANSYIENLGKGKFKISKLPNELQFSCVQSIVIKDFNKDGNLDILGAGNLYTAEVETPRNDASIGFLALGNGKGQFSFQPYKKSGVFLKGDVKDMADVKINDDESFIIVGLNDEKNKILKY